jgi:adenylate cyclase
MADVFISYARADKARVAPLVAAIEARGWSVWWDPEISPGREFDDEIDTELQAAKAVLVVWTPTSVVSRWVRGEARDAAERGLLVPVRFDQARLPIDVRAIHTTDLDGWREDPSHPAVQ